MYTFVVHIRWQLGREDFVLMYSHNEYITDIFSQVAIYVEGGVLPMEIKITGPLKEV